MEIDCDENFQITSGSAIRHIKLLPALLTIDPIDGDASGEIRQQR
jgi:hypothetical protein